MKFSFIGSCAIVVLLSSSLSQAAPVTKPPNRAWTKKMQALSKTLTAILPELSTTETVSKDFVKNVKTLADLAHGLKKPKKLAEPPATLPPDADPSIDLIGDIFDREVKRAYRSLKSGQVSYAKSLLRTSTAYCIACHSRNSAGPEFLTIRLDDSYKKLSVWQRAQILAATRQFDGALDAFESLIEDSKLAKNRPIEWQQAVRQSLAIAVRVKKDPERAGKIVDKVVANPGTDFMLKNATAWKESIASWKAAAASPTDADGLFEKAKAVLAEARSSQKYQMDHAGDVQYLRATALLHDQLRIAPNGANSNEALLLIGEAYEALGDPMLYPIHEMYYEACIRKAPHTAMAKRCYERYEESVYFGYSGSGGFGLPTEVQSTLNSLRIVAGVKKDDKEKSKDNDKETTTEKK